MSATQLQSPQGCRDAALDLLERTRADWVSNARAAAIRIARERGSVTINDVRQIVPPPAGVDPRVMGAVMRAPTFKAIGFCQSDRRTCHGRPIRVFALNEGEGI